MTIPSLYVYGAFVKNYLTGREVKKKDVTHLVASQNNNLVTTYHPILLNYMLSLFFFKRRVKKNLLDLSDYFRFQEVA